MHTFVANIGRVLPPKALRGLATRQPPRAISDSMLGHSELSVSLGLGFVSRQHHREFAERVLGEAFNCESSRKDKAILKKQFGKGRKGGLMKGLPLGVVAGFFFFPRTETAACVLCCHVCCVRSSARLNNLPPQHTTLHSSTPHS